MAAKTLRRGLAGLLTCALCAVCACTPVTTRNSELTQGNVQLHLRVGETTKAEVLEVFGAPNVTTRDGSGQETWSYQRAATASESQSASGVAGRVFAGGLVLAGGGRATSAQQTSRMMTLIIKFDDRDVVSDFKSRESNF